MKSRKAGEPIFELIGDDAVMRNFVEQAIGEFSKEVLSHQDELPVMIRDMWVLCAQRATKWIEELEAA